VSISSGVMEIGDSAFRACTRLTSVTIPSSVTFIGTQAFDSCSNLEVISVEASSTTFSARDGVLMNKDETTLFQCPGGKSGEYTIPSTVTSINPYAFAYCAGLTSVTIPPGVTAIGPDTFRSCSGMTSVTIPSGVTIIDINAFYDCTGLKSVTIPASTMTVNSYAFYNCTSLTSVNISSGVTEIGLHAFRLCTSLTSVSIPASVTQIGFYAFAECSSLVSISIPASNVNYSTIGGVLFNKAQTTLIQYPGGKTGAYTIPSSVTSIGIEAFRSCTGLTSVTIPSSVTSIGPFAFTGCSNLASFSVSASSANYSTTGGVLCNKTKTTLIWYPGGRIGGYTIPAGITSIGTSAFASCAGLTSVTIPAGVTTIGNRAFMSCKSLTSVTISSTVTRIGTDSFLYCTGLTSVTIPSSVTSIGSFAFSGCTGLRTAIFLGNAPTSFGGGVFQYTASDFTIRFYAGATGFTTPTWNDYPTVALPTDLVVMGFVRNANGSVTMTWPAPKGVTNPSLLTDVVYRSGSLAGWSAIASPLAIDAGMVVFTDPSPPPGKGFYRIGRPISP
jgi:BspA type Leucine rich repeat region (6 copies)